MQTEKLLDLNYYIDKVSLAMQNDPIFMMQISDLVKFLNQYNSQIDNFKSALQMLLYDIIFNDAEINDYPYVDLLEKVATIFNISRHFTVDFKNPLTNEVDEVMKQAFDQFNQTMFDNPPVNQLPEEITLTDNQMRMLIYCAIMKNSYDGSYEMMYDAYDVVCKFITHEYGDYNWNIYQYSLYISSERPGASGTTESAIGMPANAYCIMRYSGLDVKQSSTSDLQYFTLFFAGMMTIKSAGIYYYYTATILENILIWASSPSDAGNAHKWDSQRWL